MANSSDRIAKQYVLQKEIGTSKTGQLFLGVDERNNAEVAVKIVFKQDAHQRERLLQVCHTLAQLNHPNILRIYASGDLPNGDIYIVSEYLDGFTLNHIVPKDVGLGLPEAWPVITQIVAGLNAAHEAGILHLDLKPSNIFVSHDDDENEIIKLIDFGISQYGADAPEHVFGTPGYVAVELITKTEAPSVQSDVYGLGALILFTLTGRRPFQGSTSQEILENQVRGNINQTEEPLQSILQIAMSQNTHTRYASVSALSDALSEIHRQQITVSDSENDQEEPNEKLSEFGLGRFLIASVVLALLGTTLLLYFWLMSGT